MSRWDLVAGLEEVTICEPLDGLKSIMEIRQVSPQIRRITIQGAAAIQSVISIITPYKLFWPKDEHATPETHAEWLDKIRSAEKIVLSKDEAADANIGVVFGFKWSYVPKADLPHFGRPQVWGFCASCPIPGSDQYGSDLWTQKWLPGVVVPSGLRIRFGQCPDTYVTAEESRADHSGYAKLQLTAKIPYGQAPVNGEALIGLDETYDIANNTFLLVNND